MELSTFFSMIAPALFQPEIVQGIIQTDWHLAPGLRGQPSKNLRAVNARDPMLGEKSNVCVPSRLRRSDHVTSMDHQGSSFHIDRQDRRYMDVCHFWRASASFAMRSRSGDIFKTPGRPSGKRHLTTTDM
jgi:hypothetical protein